MGTGLSIGGSIIWLIHLIQWELPQAVPPSNVDLILALSTKAGLAVIPELKDPGCIDMGNVGSDIAGASGAYFRDGILTRKYSPAIPLAAPNLSVYTQTLVNTTDWIGGPQTCRVGFTTKDVGPNTYLEIVSTWGYTP
jgi:hypothetical protein